MGSSLPLLFLYFLMFWQFAVLIKFYLFNCQGDFIFLYIHYFFIAKDRWLLNIVVSLFIVINVSIVFLSDILYLWLEAKTFVLVNTILNYWFNITFLDVRLCASACVYPFW